MRVAAGSAILNSCVMLKTCPVKSANATSNGNGNGNGNKYSAILLSSANGSVM